MGAAPPVLLKRGKSVWPYGRAVISNFNPAAAHHRLIVRNVMFLTCINAGPTSFFMMP
jgi:hypothetical protein